MIAFLDLFGYIGMVVLLIAWYFSRTHYKKSCYINLAGGLLMSIWAYALGPSGIPALILNTAWSIIGIYNLWKLRKEKK